MPDHLQRIGDGKPKRLDFEHQGIDDRQEHNWMLVFGLKTQLGRNNHRILIECGAERHHVRGHTPSLRHKDIGIPGNMAEQTDDEGLRAILLGLHQSHPRMCQEERDNTWETIDLQGGHDLGDQDRVLSLDRIQQHFRDRIKDPLLLVDQMWDPEEICCTKSHKPSRLKVTIGSPSIDHLSASIQISLNSRRSTVGWTLDRCMCSANW